MSQMLLDFGTVTGATPLREVAFTVIDLETTGGAPATCEITEVGAVRVRGGQREAELTTLVRPASAIPRQITVLTGISDHHVADAPPVTTILPTLMEFWRGSVLVAHNARFDVAFLNAALERHDYPTLARPVVCTATLARRLVRDEVADCRLATLARHFRTRHEPIHRALPDARTTVEVLHTLLERASGLGVLTLDGLLELCARRDLEAVAQRHRLADRLPTAPGVYAFRSASGEVLYIGKAVDLRARVRGYFGADPRRMVRGLLRETDRIDHRVCPTPLEAEIRELRAITTWRPRFNRRHKPPRTAVWVKLTTERFPRLSIVRTVRDDGAGYLGPLRSTRAAERLRDALHDALPLRRCTMKITARTRVQACALAEIGRCCAPCTGEVEPHRYQAVVDQARAAMSDGSGPAIPRLRDIMVNLAADERYAEAGWRRDRLTALVDAAQRQRVSLALEGVRLSAYRPVDVAMVDLVVLVDGRFSASARCRRTEVERTADHLAASVAAVEEDDDPFLVATERSLLTRWLSASDVVVLSVSGDYSEPVDGGRTLHDITVRLRRRRTTGAPADELTSKRLRRH
ncbi:MAG TPA: DEDD exonuclease domain-containing protein [Euzebyales bacterium]|nr:DEDD exonuclease domain-containing protein [Euzebyales bacterium]